MVRPKPYHCNNVVTDFGTNALRGAGRRLGVEPTEGVRRRTPLLPVSSARSVPHRGRARRRPHRVRPGRALRVRTRGAASCHSGPREARPLTAARASKPRPVEPLERGSRLTPPLPRACGCERPCKSRRAQPVPFPADIRPDHRRDAASVRAPSAAARRGATRRSSRATTGRGRPFGTLLYVPIAVDGTGHGNESDTTCASAGTGERSTPRPGCRSSCNTFRRVSRRERAHGRRSARCARRPGCTGPATPTAAPLAASSALDSRSARTAS